MPTPAYMTIAGATQGDISAGAMSAESVGTMSNRAQEDAIQIQEFELDVQIPTDPQSGQPTGWTGEVAAPSALVILAWIGGCAPACNCIAGPEGFIPAQTGNHRPECRGNA